MEEQSIEEAAKEYKTTGQFYAIEEKAFIAGAKSQAARDYHTKDTYSLEFILWYSGMTKGKIEAAYQRFLKEK
jgi:hypothetical protein